MTLSIHVLAGGLRYPSQANSAAYLEYDNWDDFGHKTMFRLTVFDNQGNQHTIGDVKIAFEGQGLGRTIDNMPEHIEVALPLNFYSLGQDADYYKNLVNKLSQADREFLLLALGDVVFNEGKLASIQRENAFETSLLRGVSISSIEYQFARILRGDAPLTEYDFFYQGVSNDRFAGIKVEFSVNPRSKPSSNIHILIGRNGVGKTTLLNNMVDALIPGRGTTEDTGFFARSSLWGGMFDLEENYFAGVVLVSFSAFDPFMPPPDQLDQDAGMRFSYIGLKKKYVTDDGEEHWVQRDKIGLCSDFILSLKIIFSQIAKKGRWVSAVRTLESDFNFAEMELCELVSIYARDISESKHQFADSAASLFRRMSSGHAIVLLTITRLIETVEEKTLVLIDEPESHLHPPLLSAFTRALSDLLVNRNGVAIVATHSPVVLQEVPMSCVSILRRNRLSAAVERPVVQTFAENVGILTREVFGLEVSKSGYHELLKQSVIEGRSYEEIEQEYQSQLGFEGKTILRSLILARGSQGAYE